MVVHPAAGELGEVFDPGRIVALVGHADQRVSGADEVCDFCCAWEEGDNAHAIATLTQNCCLRRSRSKLA
jgi:hypothetical protein